MYKSQKAVRELFWKCFPDTNKKKIKDYSGKGKMYTTDTRVMFVEFVDYLVKSEQITNELAQRVTL